MTLLLTQAAFAQAAHTAKKSKGPRALGLLEFATKDKARLIPIEILYDGEYYDAGAYKASPVPLAIWSGTVYEGFQSGVSQGLFTVTGALENPQTKDWLAEGTWLPAGVIAAKAAKKNVSSIPRGLEDESGPPVLRRATAEPPKEPAAPPAPPAAPTPQTPPQPQAPAAPPPAAAPPTPAATPSPASAPPAPPPDTYHPTLQRGKPAAAAPPDDFPPMPTASSPAAAKHPAGAAPAKAAPLQLVPAISDANGPEPQSYKFEMKPDEETRLRAKAMTLAADEVRAWAKQISGATTAPSPSAARPRQKAGTAASRSPQPAFTEVQFHAFDLSNSNEPILILTAGVRLPPSPKQNVEPAAQTEFLVALVAREDINGDFHKVFSNVTDADHLDVLPRMDFIDAVDADGDGRGELLFRQVSDSGSSFVVYRVIGNQVWTLFQGSPAT